MDKYLEKIDAWFNNVEYKIVDRMTDDNGAVCVTAESANKQYFLRAFKLGGKIEVTCDRTVEIDG